MEKVILGNSGGIQVSRIGLGCMSMSAFYVEPATGGRSVAEKETECLHVISEALDVLGVNFFDTADIYGDNELLLARAFALRPRSSFVLATKFGAVGGGKPERVKQAIMTSLERLKLGQVDLYYLHRVDPETPIEATVGAMKAVVGEGKARTIGLSEASAATLRRAHAVHPISALQTEYSLWTRDIEGESGILATCRELGVTLVAYSPLGRGFLTGPVSLGAGDWRQSNPRFVGDAAAHNAEVVDGVAAVAKRIGCTPAQLALAWALAKGRDIVPIPGTTRLSRMRENAAAASIVLPPAVVQEVEAIVQQKGIVGERYTAEFLQRCTL